MEQQASTSSRKKFIRWSLGLLGALTAWKLGTPTPAPEKKNTVKMLSQDGRLIEVDASKIGCGKRKKITDEQLKNWVAKND